MASNVNTKQTGQTANAPKASTSSGSQSPSVPISLYREVASELQTTRTSLQSLKTQNQELVQKNQQLRLEIERVVQSALHLRQLADASWMERDLVEPPTSLSAEMLLATAPASTTNPAIAGEQPAQKLHTEQDAKPHTVTRTENPSEISTWWLILIICMIVVSAFGTGFLIVRPLLPSR